MSQLATKLQPQPEWHSGLSNQIQTLIDFGYSNYDKWYRHLLCDKPDEWTPWDHIQILHGKSPNKANFFTIDRSYAWAVKGDNKVVDLEEWKSQDMRRRSRVSYDNTWTSKSWQTNRCQHWGDQDWVFQNECTELERANDTFISMSEFGNPSYYGPQIRARQKDKEMGVPVDERTRVKRYARNASNAINTGAVWADIDNLANHGLDEMSMAAFFLAYCENEGIPIPTYIMFSGRGLHCVWLLDQLYKVDAKKGSIRKRWYMLMDHLQKRLEIFQPDTSVVDLARVLRLAGTINTKSGQVVRPIFVNKHDHGPVRYIFNDLFIEMGMTPPDEYMAMKHAIYEANGKMWRRQNAERAARIEAWKERAGDDGRSILGQRSRHGKIIQDLDKWHQGEWDGGEIGDNLQDLWLFHRTCHLAMIAPPKQVKEEVQRLGNKIGLGAKQALKNMGTVIRRAQEQVVLNQAKADGTDPSTLGLRYYSTSYDSIAYSPTVARTMNDLKFFNDKTQAEVEEMMREYDLRILITADIRRERDRLRRAEERSQAKTPQSRDHIKKDAVHAAQALSKQMLANGWSIREAAAAKGMSKSAIHRLLQHKTACPALSL